MITKRKFVTGSRLFLALVLVFVLAAASAGTARALEVDQDGIVGKDEVVNDDLILAEDTVRMDGTVNGTLIAMGGDVTVSGTVDGDVIAGGANVNITGTVKGNLFVFGGEAVVTGSVEDSLFFGGNSLTVGPEAAVGRNLYAAGFSVVLESGSSIGRDAAVAGYQFLVDGQVERDIHASLGALEINGKVGRNITAEVGQMDPDSRYMRFMTFTPYNHVTRIVPTGIRVSENAQVGGTIEYYSSVDQAAEIKQGSVIYHYVAQQADEYRTNAAFRIDWGAMVLSQLFSAIRELLTLVLLGALVVWLIPVPLTRAAGILRSKPLPSIGWGFLVLIAGLVSLILGIFVVGLLGLAVGVVTLTGLMGLVYGIGFSALALSGTVFFGIAQFGSKLVVALVVGDLVVRLFNKQYNANPFWPMLLGIVLYIILFAVPILGVVVSLFVILFGFGAIWLVFRDWWQKRKAPAA